MPLLTGPQRKLLCTSVLGAFNADDLRQVLRFELDISLEHMVSDGPLESTVFDLVERLEEKGQTEQFLLAIAKARMRNTGLQETVKLLRSSLDPSSRSESTPRKDTIRDSESDRTGEEDRVYSLDAIAARLERASPTEARNLQLLAQPIAEYTDRTPIAIATVATAITPLVGLLGAAIATGLFSKAAGVVAGLIVPLAIGVTVLVTVYRLRPRVSSAVRTWLIGLGGLFAVLVIVSGFQPFRDLITNRLVLATRELGMTLPQGATHEFVVQYSAVICGTISVLVLLWNLDRRRTITPGPGAIGNLSLFSDSSGFQEALRRYCGALADYLNAYDRAVNWSDRDYAPLEAEVEAERAGRLRARLVSNLVKAIRRDRHSPTFIVIGEPGSGKSVSLRNLVRSLIGEASRSGVVPVFVNLREFPADRQVTVDALVQFSHESVREQTGRDGEAFLKGWYERFRQSGQLFFVFDSFDELPQVLDADDRSDTHQSVCRSFDKLFTQEVRSCRAVLASRPFRAPSGVQGTRLVIRQLTEGQVRQIVGARLFGRGFDAPDLVRRVFRERPELIPLLRNPFTAELLTDFAREHGGELPSSTYDIFDAYVTNRMEADQAILFERLAIESPEMRRAAQALALELFTGDRGLEMDATWATSHLDGTTNGRGRELVEGLKFTRLVRVGGHRRPMLTFAHRRFAEFFAVEGIRSQGNTPPIEGIPTDSRWRDGLVMYCGVASTPERARVADFCWRRVRGQAATLTSGQVGDASDAIHCLRFLTDAFRSVPPGILDFREALGLVLRKMIKSPDPLVAKIAAEAIPLADEHNQQRALLRAMSSRFDWVRETAISACRNLPRLRETTLKSVRRYYRYLPIVYKVQQFRDLDFSLGLSTAFERVRWALWGDVFEAVVLVAASTLITCRLVALPQWRWPFVLSLVLIGFLAIAMTGSTGIDRLIRLARRTSPGQATGRGRTTGLINLLYNDSQRPQTVLPRGTAPLSRALSSYFAFVRRRMRPFYALALLVMGRVYRDSVCRACFVIGYAAVAASSLSWLGHEYSGFGQDYVFAPARLSGLETFPRIVNGAESSNGGDQREEASVRVQERRQADFVLLMVPPVLLASALGWECMVWPFLLLCSPGNWRRFVQKLLWNPALMVNECARLIKAVGVLSIPFLVSTSSVYIVSLLPNSDMKEKIMIVVPVIAVCILVASGVPVVGRMLIQNALDGKVLSRGVPARVNSEHVYAVLCELRSHAGRRTYLRGLLSQRVPISPSEGNASGVGAFAAMPDNVKSLLVRDPGLAEDWAKLQEFWLGLSR
jgi:hypothetical protein